MDFRSSTVKVYMFDSFEIYIDEVKISSQISHSKKLKNAVIYLILNRNRIVAAQELYGVLWPNEESRNPQSALKTLIHRLRNTFVLSGAPESALFIKSRPGGYRWEPQVKSERHIRRRSLLMPEEK